MEARGTAEKAGQRLAALRTLTLESLNHRLGVVPLRPLSEMPDATLAAAEDARSDEKERKELERKSVQMRIDLCRKCSEYDQRRQTILSEGRLFADEVGVGHMKPSALSPPPPDESDEEDEEDEDDKDQGVKDQGPPYEWSPSPRR